MLMHYGNNASRYYSRTASTSWCVAVMHAQCVASTLRCITMITALRAWCVYVMCKWCDAWYEWLMRCDGGLHMNGLMHNKLIDLLIVLYFVFVCNCIFSVFMTEKPYIHTRTSVCGRPQRSRKRNIYIIWTKYDKVRHHSVNLVSVYYDITRRQRNDRAVKLPWIFPTAPLIFNEAPVNIQDNLRALNRQASIQWRLIWLVDIGAAVRKYLVFESNFNEFIALRLMGHVHQHALCRSLSWYPVMQLCL